MGSQEASGKMTLEESSVIGGEPCGYLEEEHPRQRERQALRGRSVCTSRKSEEVRGLGQEVRQTECCQGSAFTGVRQEATCRP